MNRYGFVPFAAIDDLMWGLADANLLVDPPESLERLGMLDRSSWVELITPTPWLRWKARWPTVFRALELLLWPALEIFVVLTVPSKALGPIDVALRLSIQGWCCAIVSRRPSARSRGFRRASRSSSRCWGCSTTRRPMTSWWC